MHLCWVSSLSCFSKLPDDTPYPPQCSLLKYKFNSSPLPDLSHLNLQGWGLNTEDWKTLPLQWLLLSQLSEKFLWEPLISPDFLSVPHLFRLLSTCSCRQQVCAADGDPFQGLWPLLVIPALQDPTRLRRAEGKTRERFCNRVPPKVTAPPSGIRRVKPLLTAAARKHFRK